LQKSPYTRKYKQLIEILKQARQDSNLTQADVAAHFKRPQSFISKCESRERRIDVIEFLEFCKLYKISPDKLLKQLE